MNQTAAFAQMGREKEGHAEASGVLQTSWFYHRVINFFYIVVFSA
jgi:hypothetical protein